MDQDRLSTSHILYMTRSSKLVAGGRSITGSALLISTGALFGQIVIVAATPIITRLYTPSEMGLYAVFVAFVGIFATPIALHYELAVPLPRRNSEAASVAILGIGVAVATSAVLGLLMILFQDQLLEITKAGALREFMWLVPIALVATGVMNVLTTWTIRNKAFQASAASKAAQGLGQTIPQVAAGMAHIGVGGLIAGQIAGILAAVGALGTAGVPRRNAKTRRPARTRLWIVAKKYRRFALITVWSSLGNSLASQVPVMMLASLFGAYVAGQFALSFRLLQLPLRLVGGSMSQVFFAHAAEANRSEGLGSLTSSTFRGLFAFGLPSFVLAACVAPEVFRLVFGNQWEDAGNYTRLLMPWILFSFISSVLSVLVSVLQRQGLELLLQGAYLIVVVVSLATGYIYGSPVVAMATLGGLGGIYFFCKICWLLSIAGAGLGANLMFCLGECLITVPIASGLLWYSGKWESDLNGAVAGVVSILVVHGWNYWGRDVYAMKVIKAQ